MATFIAIDFQKICRVCRTKSDNLKSIYDSIISLSNNIQSSLATMLKECASVDVNIDDGLPSSMCDECIEKLRHAFEFKLECQHTDSFLRIIMQKNDEMLIKTEAVDEFPIDIVEEKPEPVHDENLLATTLEEVSNKSQFTPSKSSARFYFCKICKKKYNRLDNIKQHMVVHLKNKPFVCRICKNGFINMDRLHKHEKRCKGDKIYFCDICSRSFNRADSLKAHQDIHSVDETRANLDSLANIERYILVENVETREIIELESMQEMRESEPDSLSFSEEDVASDESVVKVRQRGRPRQITELPPSKSGLRKKKKVIFYSSNPPCPVCHKKFKKSSQLKRHMSCHITNKPFSCPLCKKKFARKDHMLRHTRFHDNQKDFKCDLCYREFSKEQQLVQHKAIKHDIGEKQVTEKKFQCDVCSKSFTTEKYRDLHVAAHQADTFKGYRCKNCNASFTLKRELLQHEKESVDCLRKFLCSECGERFIRKNYLIVHMRRHRGEKPFKCRFCGKGFPRTTDVTRHEQLHTGEKNHLCVICGKKFSRAYNLKLHIRTHTGEKPYACMFCDAAFAQSNDLRAHIRRHTGERFYCNLCPDSFLMGYMLRQHKRNVHQIECSDEKCEPVKDMDKTKCHLAI